MRIARNIRRHIQFERGISVNISVSGKKITEKLGSDYKKPNAITRIERENYKGIVYSLPVGDLLYVDPVTGEKLRRVGIPARGYRRKAPISGEMGAESIIFWCCCQHLYAYCEFAASQIY
ncbi:hypothetical protein [Oscillibacter sp.]|uniref:hypothetical protein n=1 Tax=Oscillibacter sp. TaxID=1945593 RepID=UPI0028A15150|nr:hypothetical protein [Oscillibacter sp.]